MCGYPYPMMWTQGKQRPLKRHRLTLLRRALLLFTYDPPWQYRLKNVGTLVVERHLAAHQPH